MEVGVGVEQGGGDYIPWLELNIGVWFRRRGRCRGGDHREGRVMDVLQYRMNKNGHPK